MPNHGRERIATNCVACGSSRLRKSPAILMPFVAHRALGWAPVEIDESWGLRTIPSGNAYSICNSVGCEDCGMLFLDIRFSDAEMGALYHGYREEEYTALRDHYEPGYRARNETLNAGDSYIPHVEGFLSAFLPDRIRVLDWGGDTGMNTPLKARADLFHIYDISARDAVAGATIVGLDTARDTRYDLIVCSNVLEHVPFPRELLADIKACMGPETVLYVEVPHEELVRRHGGEADLCTRKRHWHEHVNFFGWTSLRAMLEGAGFEILGLRELTEDGSGLPCQFMAACRIAR